MAAAAALPRPLDDIFFGESVEHATHTHRLLSTHPKWHGPRARGWRHLGHPRAMPRARKAPAALACATTAHRCPQFGPQPGNAKSARRCHRGATAHVPTDADPHLWAQRRANHACKSKGYKSRARRPEPTANAIVGAGHPASRCRPLSWLFLGGLRYLDDAPAARPFRGRGRKALRKRAAASKQPSGDGVSPIPRTIRCA